MPLISLHATELARSLAENLNSLRRLKQTHPDEASELLNRIRAFVKWVYPECFVVPPDCTCTCHQNKPATP